MSETAYNSKSVRLIASMAQDLQNGRFHAADPLPAENHLAELYAVSRSTIHRTLDQMVRQGLLIRKPNRGVYPALPAAADPVEPTVHAAEFSSALSTRETRRLRFGLVWAGPPDALGIAVNSGLRNYCREHDIEMMRIGTTHEEALRILENPESHGLDALVCWPYCLNGYQERFAQLVSRHFPLVFVDRPVGALPVSTIEVDNLAGAYEATMCLILKHHAPVLYFGTYSPAIRTLRMRREGYLHALHDAGFTPPAPILVPQHEGHPEHWAPEMASNVPRQVFSTFLERNELEFPLNLFCSNNYMAHGVYLATAEHHLKIGRDIRVTAFDDLPLARLLDPPLTAVRQPGESLGSEAARLLHAQFSACPPEPAILTLPVTLIERASHGDTASQVPYCRP